MFALPVKVIEWKWQNDHHVVLRHYEDYISVN